MAPPPSLAGIQGHPNTAIQAGTASRCGHGTCTSIRTAWAKRSSSKYCRRKRKEPKFTLACHSTLSFFALLTQARTDPKDLPGVVRTIQEEVVVRVRKHPRPQHQPGKEQVSSRHLSFSFSTLRKKILMRLIIDCMSGG